MMKIVNAYTLSRVLEKQTNVNIYDEERHF